MHCKKFFKSVQRGNNWRVIFIYTHITTEASEDVVSFRGRLFSWSHEAWETLQCTLVPQGHLLVLLKGFTSVFLRNEPLISDIHRLSETSHISHTHAQSQNQIDTSCLQMKWVTRLHSLHLQTITSAYKAFWLYLSRWSNVTYNNS